MKTSTEIASAARHIGEERAVEYIAKAGFDHWDFSMHQMYRYSKLRGCPLTENSRFTGNGYLALARQLRQIGLDNGITCNQSHAPFPTDVPQAQSLLKRSIECTAEAGGKYCVIHPMNNATAEENAEFYWSLLPFAKEHGVKIATENMWNWNADKTQTCFAACSTTESFNAHLDAVDDPYLVGCLDIGHAEMRGSGSGAVNMIHGLGKRLKCLHVHDNDLLHDSHQLPYTMQIDFDAVLKALKEIGYDGDMTLEVDQYLTAYNSENVFKGIQKMAGTARKMAAYFD